MSEDFLPEYYEIQELLKIPIEKSCFMITKDWWNQWIDYCKDKTKKTQKPGGIYNYFLLYLYKIYRISLIGI